MKGRLIRAISNAPLTRKLIAINMLTSSVALLLACVGFMSYEALNFKSEMTRDVEATAGIIGDNSAAALAFDDPGSAQQTLQSLRTHVHVVGAAIYDKDGRVFAFYRRSDDNSFAAPPSERAGSRFEGEHLKLFKDIELAGEKAGTVYIQSDLEALQARMRRYAAIFLFVMSMASGIAFLLSRKLQKAISSPIAHLGGVAARVSADKNYSLRAIKQSDDELGNLTDRFNEMLDQIQQRDSALQVAQGDLEKRVAARTQELAQSISLLNATLESSTDGVMAYQFGVGMVCSNSRYQEMWNIPDLYMRDRSYDTDRLNLVASQLMDPSRLLNRQPQERKDVVEQEFEILETKDGRIIERYLRPQMVNGATVGVVVTFRDITERKRAERELESVNRRLLESSRQAGMAEVATGVLHNVGNVLNSVNVSANLLSESAKRSKVSSLAKVVGLLEEHKQDLAAFMGDDPRGKHLPQFLAQLWQLLRHEQEENIKELESLRKNVDHIKQIVSMQQAYSKVSGVREVVNLIDLLEDTLRLNEAALHRHGVRIVREFDASPQLNTEKHKILQILVNLVRNAKLACSDSPRTDKCITLRVRQLDDKAVVSVIDNGVGIAAENLTRIFSHGFTTRKDGHGFGLHSGALAARELGGALRAHSDGPGRGAIFTLELPIETEKNQKALEAV